MILDNYKIRRDYEKLMESEKWRKEIPFIKFKEGWEVKITPNFAGSVIRFLVKYKEKEVSVYLDCYDNLGCEGQPYWEIYPYSNDTFRCYINETDKLLVAINESLSEQL